MIFKAKLIFKIILGPLGLFMIMVPFIAIIQGNIFNKDIISGVLTIFFMAIIFVFGIDEIFQLFRVININNQYIEVKLFGIIIKKDNILTIAYTYKKHGLKILTNIFGIKSIIINDKYFSYITEMDINYDRIMLNINEKI
jgi:hypothetical protein